MTFGGKVDYAVNLVRGDNPPHFIKVGNICSDKSIVGLAFNVL